MLRKKKKKRVGGGRAGVVLWHIIFHFSLKEPEKVSQLSVAWKPQLLDPMQRERILLNLPVTTSVCSPSSTGGAGRSNLGVCVCV